MSEAKDNEIGDIDFAWGIKRGRGGQKKEVQFYDSFTYGGVEYFLYDSVYLFKEGEGKPYIGKLIKIWEHTTTNARKVKVLWFFYPWEISNYLNGENVLENELFLASGVGKGLANINPLEAIAGKCNVVCISKDERNRQPSAQELKMAHHVFYRTFDVQNHTVSDTLGETIAMTEVNLLLNKNDFQSLDLCVVDSGNTAVCLEESLISYKYILGADGTMERDASIGSLLLKDKQEAKSSLDKSKRHHVRNTDVDEPDNSDLVAGREKMLVNKDPKGVDEDENYDDKGLKGDGNADVPDGLGLVVLPVTEAASASSGQKRSRAPDSKKNDVNEKGVVPPVAAADNKKSKLVKDNHQAIVAGAKVKSDHSDDKPFKKIKIIGTDLLSSANGGTSTPKSATVVSNKGSQSAVGVGIDSNKRGRLIKESNVISIGLSKKLKSEDKSDDKLLDVSAKQSQDKEGSAALYISANKASQSFNGDAETDDKGKFSRKIAGTSNGLSKKLKSNSMVGDKSNDNLRKALIKNPKDEEAYGCVKQVTQRPPDRSKWFTASPWEERMKDAHDQGRLVLLQNLDPTFTSSDVENIVWHGFGESCNAKVVQHNATSSRRFGQAFVIFKTRDLAEKIIKRLDKECLMLQNGRPLVGSRYGLCFPGKPSQFPGHLIVDKLRHQMQRETRDAVSTSHSAQPNTLEYEMALEWRLLQERSELSWKMLYKKQEEQIKKIMANEKSK
ncbi:protein ANTI-SILENCING 1-like [Chenopodium quinoa]|uniref:protein ANTI-SILENCING 1-like n=1 Tax=Chenopodium quinoa TaxID=63459 RepID=UPI000B789534|nr:protein ANTI-SILENCING 1-like [Chenopodium quinoa]